MTDPDRRWYDNSKMIWGLFGILSVSILGCVGIVWGVASSAKDSSAENAGSIRELRAKVEDHTKQLDKLEGKVDQILFEIRKR